MNEAEIYLRLTSVFHDVFDDDTIEVTPDLTAKDVDDWDSLTHIRLMLTVERAFQIRLSTPEISGMKNVGDLVALIRNRA